MLKLLGRADLTAVSYLFNCILATAYINEK